MKVLENISYISAANLKVTFNSTPPQNIKFFNKALFELSSMVLFPFPLWQRVMTVDISLWLDVVSQDHPAGETVQGVHQESHLVPG